MTERSLFLAALEIEEPAARRSYLDEACRTDPALRERVDALLAADEEARTFMDRPPAATPFGLPTAERAGSTLTDGSTGPAVGATGTTLADRYLVGEEIGRGGMGTVYRAEQLRPVRREVAVKLINPGMDSRSVLTRFEAERQALAVMDHPHIARVLEAGATPEGRPFFVMELVRGVPLTDYCDAHHLAMTGRLELFRQVCGAVQHAHQKGVIHRDLKPGNILVEEHDGVPNPKVIDFGLAKAVGGAALTEQTLFTAPGSVAGTPLYMAPEQAGPDAGDVDTRADVYALGAIFYELLTGSPPINRETLRRAALHEILRVIREVEPQPPSSRLGSSPDLPTVAANRGTEPDRLGRFVHGDLDWVALKALEKDRARRYETAAALGADVERFLHHEPVAAGPPTLRYRAGKFVRRNRAAVVAATLVLLALVAGIIGTSLGLIEARRQRDAADLARHAEAAQRLAAVEEAGNAAAVRDFLLRDLLLQSAPALQSGLGEPDKDVKVRTLLDRASGRLPGPFEGRPLLEGSLRAALGRAYHQLGEDRKAATHLALATDLLARARGAGDVDTIRAATALASADEARGEPAAALQRLDALLVVARRARDLPPGVLAEILLTMAQLKLNQRNPAEADRFLAEAGGEVARLGRDDPIAFNYEVSRANALIMLGRISEAEALSTEAYDRCRRANGEAHPMTSALLGRVTVCLSRQGKIKEAIERGRRLVEVADKVQGPDAPDTLTARFNLARSLQDDGQREEAEAIYRGVAEARGRLRGPDHFQTLGVLFYLAETIRGAGRFADAEPIYERARVAQRANLGPGSRPEALNGSGRAACLIRLGRHAEAEPLLRDSLAIYEKSEASGWRAALVRSRLGAALLGQRRFAEAEPLLIEGYTGLRDRPPAVPLATFTPDDRRAAAEAADRLVELYEALTRPDELKKWQAERAKYPPSILPSAR